MKLVPYVEVDGSRTIPDSLLSGFFEEMERDELTDIVFYTNELDSSQFVKMMKNPANLPVFIWDDGLKGVAWINNLADNHAMGHFCFLKSGWGKFAEQAGEEVLKYWFAIDGSNGPLFDLIFGFIPEFNQRAVNFSQRIGFTKLGVIPKLANVRGERSGMVILYRTR